MTVAVETPIPAPKDLLRENAKLRLPAMVSRLPSLRGIETFVCVAELLNFRLASERLNVTVSAISHRIQSLEQELGTQLLDRSRRQLSLTPDGETYLNQLRPGVSLLLDATLAARREFAKPVFRIAAPPIFTDWLAHRIRDFACLHPNMRFEILTSGRRRSAAADVSILALTNVNQREGATPLVKVDIAPICSPAFLASHPIRNVGDLLTIPLIDTVPSLKFWDEWFSAAGAKDDSPAPAFAFDNQALLYKAVSQGLGVALGMRALVVKQIEDGEFVEPLPISYEYRPQVGILINANGNLKVAKGFETWVRTALAI